MELAGNGEPQQQQIIAVHTKKAKIKIFLSIWETVLFWSESNMQKLQIYFCRFSGISNFILYRPSEDSESIFQNSNHIMQLLLPPLSYISKGVIAKKPCIVNMFAIFKDAEKTCFWKNKTPKIRIPSYQKQHLIGCMLPNKKCIPLNAGFDIIFMFDFCFLRV